MSKSFAVIGLGTFGQQLCESLSSGVSNILAVDIDEKKVDKVSEFVSHTVCCDCTRQENVEKLGLRDIDHIIIAIGSNIQASILITVILKEMGVKNLIVRVDDDYYAPVLKKLGADSIINPQKTAVQSLAVSLMSRSFTDFYTIADNYGVAQLKIVKPQEKIALKDMDLRIKYGVNVLMIKRQNKTFVPQTSDVFKVGDEVIIFASKQSIAKMDKIFGK